MTLADAATTATTATPSTTTRHPVISGFHPDPSVCRVGDDYYLVASSFEYFPGVPIFHSRDLVQWEQLGNVLDRVEQFSPGHGADSRGIFAPTLRHHDGRFWMITTDVSGAEAGHLLVTATDPAVPWSDPVRIPGAAGIDPDLAWDDDGTCFLTWCSTDPALPGIAQAIIDPERGELLETPRPVWSGTGLAWPEAPHLYRIDDWWYLIVAEGGTERGHCVSIARSRHIAGPYDGNPANPVLSHRSTVDPVQNTGHADLVQAPDGRWAMVFLGVRPRGTTPMFHVNGRETFLAGVTWVDGWPTVDEARFPSIRTDHSFVERVEDDPLDPRWVSPNTDPARLVGRETTGASVTLVATVEAAGHSGMLATRVRDEYWQATLRVDPAEGVTRMLLRLDDRHWYGIEADAATISAVARIGRLASIVATLPRERTGPIDLVVASRVATMGGPDDIELGFDDDGYVRLAMLDGRYLSTEVAGGFTGRVLGIQSLVGSARLESFTYSAAPAMA